MAKITNSYYTKKLNTAKSGVGSKASEITFTVRTIQRRKLDRNYKSTDKCWIYLEFQLGKKRKYFSTKLSCNYGDLDTVNFVIKDNHQGTRLIQHYKSEAIKFYTDLVLTERPIDLDLIKSAVLNCGTLGIPTFQQALNLHLDELKTSLSLGELAHGTFRKINVWVGHLTQFADEKLGRNLRLESITPHDIKTFIQWLKLSKKMSHNSSQMVAGHFNRVMRFCLENEWITRNPFMNYKRRLEVKKVEALSETEIELIENLNIVGDYALDRAKDVFLFMIYTGLSYTDCHSLRQNHILLTEDKDFYIFKPRDKTSREQTIYLSNKALTLLEKYREDPYCLKYGFMVPIVSNSKINNHLKTIQRFAGIAKNLTCRISRSTYSTILYDADLSEKAMRYTMGHSKSEMTLKHYIKQDHKGIIKDLKEAHSRSKTLSN